MQMLFRRFVCQCVIAFGIVLGGNMAIDQDAPPARPDKISLDDLMIDISRFAEPENLEDMRIDRMFDLDGDGAIDMQLEWNRYRGPMSTYGTNWFIRAMPHCRLLRGSEPFGDGDRVSLDDITRAVNHARLHSAGGSLMFPDRHMREFSGGPWYERSGVLVVLMDSGDGLIVAQIGVTVDDRGEITIGQIRLTRLGELLTIDM